MSKISITFLFFILISLILKFNDFLFYYLGIQLFITYLLGLISYICIIKYNNKTYLSLFLLTVFFLFFIIVQFITSYYFPDSIIFIFLLFSISTIYLYLSRLNKLEKEKLLIGVYLILIRGEIKGQAFIY
jgi:uncharacterized membrane protein